MFVIDLTARNLKTRGSVVSVYTGVLFWKWWRQYVRFDIQPFMFQSWFAPRLPRQFPSKKSRSKVLSAVPNTVRPSSCVIVSCSRQVVINSFLPGRLGQVHLFTCLRNQDVIGRLNTRTEKLKSTFYPNCLSEWNKLEPEVRLAPSVAVFKKKALSIVRSPGKICLWNSRIHVFTLKNSFLVFFYGGGGGAALSSSLSILRAPP